MSASEPRLPSLSEKEFTVLNLLIGRPKSEKYGLELVALSEGQLKRGTIYVTLSRMEDKGYIESSLEKRNMPAAGTPRRLYRATGLGERVYTAWSLAQKHMYGIFKPRPA